MSYGTIAVCSGYFNPLHKGHVDYLRSAKKLADELIVIVNNDNQVKQKGSTSFMDESERLYIVQHLSPVDLAMLSTDQDESVCETLRLIFDIRPAQEIIFANGGDRKEGDVPEYDICDLLGIKMVFNVGGKKTQSSSNLLDAGQAGTKAYGS
jgi:cytidyltransferase-like protein